MSRKVKCPTCDEWFIREETEHVFDGKKKRYFHKDCYIGISTAEEDRDSLYKAMCEIFKYEFVVPRIRRQINDMMEEYGYTYKGIELTLDYVYRIEKMDKEKANGGIGIVPWFYDKASELYLKKMGIWEVKELNYETVIIKVDTSQKKKKTNGKAIDIGGL